MTPPLRKCLHVANSDVNMKNEVSICECVSMGSTVHRDRSEKL